MNKFRLINILASNGWVLISVLFLGASAFEILFLYWLDMYAYGVLCLIVGMLSLVIGPEKKKDIQERWAIAAFTPFATVFYSFFTSASLIILLIIAYKTQIKDIESDHATLDVMAWTVLSSSAHLLIPGVFIVIGAFINMILDARQLKKSGEVLNNLVGKPAVRAVAAHFLLIFPGGPLIMIAMFTKNLMPVLVCIVLLKTWLDVRRAKKEELLLSTKLT